MPSPDSERIQLINGVYCLFSDNVTCLANWGFYLFDPAFAAERELRNKIGVICIASLLDAIEGADRMLEGYIKRSTDLESLSLVIACSQAATFVQLIKDVASLFTREEQAFIGSMRDQLVHSWLAKRHRDQISFKFFDGTHLTSHTLPAKEYHALVRHFYEAPDGLEGVLARLVDRFLREPIHYWSAFHAVNASLPELQQALLEDREFVIPGFVRAERGR